MTRSFKILFICLTLSILSTCGFIGKYPEFGKLDFDKDFGTNMEMILGKTLKFGEAHISKRDRNIMLAQLYNKVNDLSNTGHAKTILKYDLLKLEASKKQFQHCPISPLEIFMHKKDISRKDYQNITIQLINKIEDEWSDSAKMHDYLQTRAEEKIKLLERFIDKIDIMPKYGGIDEIKRLFNENKAYERSAFKILENNYKESDVEGLNKKLEILEAMGTIAEHMPVMNPMPGAKVIRHFGKRFDPFIEKFTRNYGMDIRAPSRTVVVAAGKGYIKFAGPYQDLGHTVIIDHGHNLLSYYSYLEFPMLVKMGDKVEVNQPIGFQGSSGDSVIRNLHYEIKVGGRAIDPRVFMRAGTKCHYAHFTVYIDDFLKRRK